jgi:5-methylcytosine-specific restriction enzyme subunit McrC
MIHRIELAEYESICIRAAPPTAADLTLSERLSTRVDLEPRLVVRWLTGGKVEVTASSWVGVVRFSSLEIRVVPKLVGNALGVLRMLEYAAGVRLIARLPIDRELPANGSDLFELIVMLLVEETKLLIRDGLIRDYRPVDDTLEVMRGRLRLREQFIRRYGTLHRLECHFDEYDGDVPENQLLAVALAAASRKVQDHDVRISARIVAEAFSDICFPTTRDPDAYSQKIVYGRLNARYRSAHELAVLVLRGLALTDLFDTSSGRITAFMLDMNVIFERFVTRLVENSLAGSSLRVSSQSTYRAVILDDRTGRTYNSIRPDLVVVDTESGAAVPIDLKYKLYDTKKYSSADIYQLFLYAYTIGGETSSRAAGLIYPTTKATFGRGLRIQPAAGAASARIRGAGLNVPKVLNSLCGAAADTLHASVLEMILQITGLGASVDGGRELTSSRRGEF